MSHKKPLPFLTDKTTPASYKYVIQVQAGHMP